MSNIKTFFKGFETGFQNFGNIITNIINYTLLSVVYIVGVGLTSIVSKIFGKHFIDIQKKDVKTYWKDLNLKTKPIEKYYRQF